MSALRITALHKTLGTHPVLTGLDLTVPAGSLTALLGPSGAGKTTLLRLIAGFERPDHGTITIADTRIDGDGAYIRPEHRKIGYVPQEGALFPHLSAAANVGFGLPRGQRRGRVRELLDLVGLAGLERRYPHQLSGGQQQRVALARALAINPAIVLLDEPFASLDTHQRASVRHDVHTILRESRTTTLLVTHDQDEALSLADHVAVLRDGTIAQHAPPQHIYTTPADDALARFVGDANLLPGTLSGALVDTPLGRLPAILDDERSATAGPVIVLVRPEQIDLQLGTQPGLNGQIVRSEYHGHDTIHHVEASAHPGEEPLVMIVRTLGAAPIAPGSPVTLTTRGPLLVWSATGGVRSGGVAVGP
jgi:iron(III) transport system ATP-binding protein